MTRSRTSWEICLTSRERTAEALLRRIRAAPGRLHELRLDCLEHIPESLERFTNERARTIATLRPRREGGCFDGGERERVAILLRALEAEPDYLDVEMSTEAPLRRRLYEAARGRTRILLSMHDFEGIPSNAPAIAARMRREPVHGVKLAFTVPDAAAVPRLLSIAKAAGKRRIVIGMGPGGILTRILPERFGSFLAYAATQEGSATAPGQLTEAEILRYRKGRGTRPRLLGIVGGAQVLRSHGLEVYNRLLARRGIDATYVPVVTASPRRCLEALEAMGFRGVSVTQPHKMEAFRLCRKVSEEARKTGAVNTLVFSRGTRRGFNTDLVAADAVFAEAARGRRAWKPRTALAGAGGAARAVAAALADRGWETVVFNRTLENARMMAREFGFEARPLKELEGAAKGFDILVNCTSVGMDSDECIVGDAAVLAGKIVVDLVSHPVETRLMAEARRAGAAMTVSGAHFWALQGAEQMKILAKCSFRLQSIENQLI